MKILIIGSRKSWESNQILDEALKKGHSTDIVPITEIIFEYRQNKTKALWQKKDISRYDAILFRAINKHINEAGIIARYMMQLGKVVVDELVAEYIFDFNKLLMHDRLSGHKIPQPVTYKVFNPKSLELALNKLHPPFMVKDVNGLKMKKAYCFSTPEEVKKFFRQEGNFDFLIQEWLKNKKHYRVLMVGDKILGAIERDSERIIESPKISMSRNATTALIDDSLKKICVGAATAAKVEFAGFDIMFKNKKPIVIEINRSPCFRLFHKTTNVNVGEEVVKYIENKLKKKNKLYEKLNSYLFKRRF